MKRIETANAPGAVGPYSQAIQAGDTVWTAGQVGLDPATGKLVEGGVAPEAERVLENLRAVLAAAGLDFDAVVRASIYLTDMGDFGTVNEIYARHLGEARPARSTVAVSALPLGARIEIDMMAVRGG